jgi:hypothetical protein
MEEKNDEISRIIEKISVTDIKTEVKQTSELNLDDYLGKDELKPAILQEIKDFSPYCETTTLLTLFCLSHWKHGLNISPRGQGKSRSTRELLDFLRIPYIKINGRVTARSLFNKLKGDGIILIDESARILSDPQVQDLLLSALLGEEFSWDTSREAHQHQFKGIIVCNANNFSNSNETKSAILDRTLTNRFSLDEKQISEKIDSQKNYTPNLETWRVIIEKLGMVEICKKFPEIEALGDRKNEQAKISKDDLFKTLLDKYPQKRTDLQNEIDEYLKSKITGVTSMRPWERIQYVADFSYRLVGDFSIVDMLIDAIRNTDTVKNIAKMNVPRADKVKMIAELKGYSDVRSARRLLKKIEGEGL